MFKELSSGVGTRDFGELKWRSLILAKINRITQLPFGQSSSSSAPPPPLLLLKPLIGYVALMSLELFLLGRRKS